MATIDIRTAFSRGSARSSGSRYRTVNYSPLGGVEIASARGGGVLIQLPSGEIVRSPLGGRFAGRNSSSNFRISNQDLERLRENSRAQSILDTANESLSKPQEKAELESVSKPVAMQSRISIGEIGSLSPLQRLKLQQEREFQSKVSKLKLQQDDLDKTFESLANRREPLQKLADEGSLPQGVAAKFNSDVEAAIKRQSVLNETGRQFQTTFSLINRPNQTRLVPKTAQEIISSGTAKDLQTVQKLRDSNVKESLTVLGGVPVTGIASLQGGGTLYQEVKAPPKKISGVQSSEKIVENIRQRAGKNLLFFGGLGEAAVDIGLSVGGKASESQKKRLRQLGRAAGITTGAALAVPEAVLYEVGSQAIGLGEQFTGKPLEFKLTGPRAQFVRSVAGIPVLRELTGAQQAVTEKGVFVNRPALAEFFSSIAFFGAEPSTGGSRKISKTAVKSIDKTVRGPTLIERLLARERSQLAFTNPELFAPLKRTRQGIVPGAYSRLESFGSESLNSFTRPVSRYLVNQRLAALGKIGFFEGTIGEIGLGVKTAEKVVKKAAVMQTRRVFKTIETRATQIERRVTGELSRLEKQITVPIEKGLVETRFRLLTEPKVRVENIFTRGKRVLEIQKRNLTFGMGEELAESIVRQTRLGIEQAKYDFFTAPSIRVENIFTRGKRVLEIQKRNLTFGMGEELAESIVRQTRLGIEQAKLQSQVFKYDFFTAPSIRAQNIVTTVKERIGLQAFFAQRRLTRLSDSFAGGVQTFQRQTMRPLRKQVLGPLYSEYFRTRYAAKNLSKVVRSEINETGFKFEAALRKPLREIAKTQIRFSRFNRQLRFELGLEKLEAPIYPTVIDFGERLVKRRKRFRYGIVEPLKREEVVKDLSPKKVSPLKRGFYREFKNTPLEETGRGRTILLTEEEQAKSAVETGKLKEKGKSKVSVISETSRLREDLKSFSKTVFYPVYKSLSPSKDDFIQTIVKQPQRIQSISRQFAPTNFDIKSLESLIPFSISGSRIETRTQEIPKTTEKIIEKIRERRTPGGILFPEVETPELNAVMVEKVEGYNTFTKRKPFNKNKFVKRNSVPLPEENALQFGLLLADNSIAQSVKILKAGKKVNARIPPSVNLRSKFGFKSKSNTFVEKRVFAIDTRGERDNLSVARYVARVKNSLRPDRARKRRVSGFA